MHLNPALAGVLTAFLFGGRADAGGTVVLVLAALLLATFVADALVVAARKRPATTSRATGAR